MRQFIVTLTYLLLATPLMAQYYSSGADPASIRWHQVNSETFKVVYPKEFEPEAKRFIAMLDSLYTYGGYTLDHTPKPINILIHSQSAYANGFVSWAPKRMEIYPMPHQDMLPQDWLEQLAIHEFRHVVQIDKLNRGFTKVLTYPFGQQAVGAVLGLYAPLWFLEGDATLTETTLSASGRGRRPSFEQEIRAQVLEKAIYNYDKAYFGSYKDYVPNHYHMGYLFTAGARHRYGAKIWEKALEEAGRKSWSVTPFNRGIKKVSGKNKVPLYNEVFSDWQQRWQRQNDTLQASNHRSITQRNKRYKSYRYPTPLDDDYLLAEVNGPGERNHFVKINRHNGAEEHLLSTGVRSRCPFSYSHQRIAWVELEQHPRWENQHFSEIKTYDLSTGKINKISRRGRYAAPALSPDGQTIAAIYTSYTNQYSLRLLQASNGHLIREYTIPDNAFPMTPAWNEDGSALVMVLLNKKGKQIALFTPLSESWQTIVPAGFTEIRYPKIYKDSVFFTGSYSGIENIYRTALQGGSIEQITTSKFGAAYANVYNNLLYYQDYTSDGYQLVERDLQTLKAQTITPRSLPSEPFLQTLHEQEKGLPRLKSVDTSGYQSKKYSKWNLFNFHSWAPVYMNVSDGEVGSGVSFLSQNLLGTTFTSLGYRADQQYSREKFSLNLTHRAWWPEFSLDLKMGNEKLNYDGYYTNNTDTFRVVANAKPQHIQAELEVTLPLNLSRGKYLRRIEPSMAFSYHHSSDYKEEITYVSIIDDEIVEKEQTVNTVPGIDIKSLDFNIFAYNLLRSTQRDIDNRWGQVLELSYRTMPFSGWDYGSILGVHTRLYFPGIGRHHAIRIDNGWQIKQKGEQYGTMGPFNYYMMYPDYLRFPRGVDSFYNDELYTFKGDYMLPLINPDLNIPGLIYLKRISANVFYDFSQARQKMQRNDTGAWLTDTKDISSFGTELRAELHPLRFVFPITLGYRYAHVPSYNKNHHEILVSMGLSGLVVGRQ